MVSHLKERAKIVLSGPVSRVADWLIFTMKNERQLAQI